MPDLNDYIKIGRAAKKIRTKKGSFLSIGTILQNSKKAEVENNIVAEISHLKQFETKQYVCIVWFVKNKRKDEGNIKFKQKFIFDAFQRAGKLKSDNMNSIITLFEPVLIDKKEERCEIFFCSDKNELLNFYITYIFDLIQ